MRGIVTIVGRGSVCVVGAGSMGVVTAHHLALAGSEVTFLVRPHRSAQLAQPKRLYSYDRLDLETLSDFNVLDDPDQLMGKHFDFLLLALDGSALRNHEGKALAKSIGRAFAGTSCVVIVGGVGIDLRSWFVRESGLADAQVVSGRLESFAHAVPNNAISPGAGVDTAVLAQADVAYRHYTPYGFCVDLSSPAAARDFAELYDRNGHIRCSLITPEQYESAVAVFASIAAWELLGWPAPNDIDPAGDLWALGAAAMREVLKITVSGQDDDLAAAPTPEGLVRMWQQMERDARPLDLAEFFRFHHGGKVSAQDHDILREALVIGRATGARTLALDELVARLPDDAPWDPTAVAASGV